VATLIFSAITSLDGYVEDERGNVDWAALEVVESSVEIVSSLSRIVCN
jgi:hypothetical protein